MIRKLTLVVFVFFLLLIPAALKADIRFELGFGWTLVGPALNSTYINRYQPILTPPDRYIASSADQTVRFKGKASLGMNGFFNVLFTENFGLQVLADYHRPAVGGSNAPYEVQLQFLAFEQETYSSSIEWPNSSGNLTETSFSLNALARFQVADNLAISASAGPSVFNIEGKVGYIGYTYFDLALVGSEYVLSGGTFRMVVDFPAQTKYGFNVGVEAAYEAFRSVILAFDLRYFGAPSADFPLSIVEDPVITKPIDEIETRIGLGSLKVNPSYFRAGLALRFVF
jgi:hypothetical protein